MSRRTLGSDHDLLRETVIGGEIGIEKMIGSGRGKGKERGSVIERENGLGSVSGKENASASAIECRGEMAPMAVGLVAAL